MAYVNGKTSSSWDRNHRLFAECASRLGCDTYCAVTIPSLCLGTSSSIFWRPSMLNWS
jgi:hypothetical protein